MCLGIPGRLVEIINDDFQVGTVEVSGVRGSVSLALVWDEIAVGDWVLVHVGFALARIDEQDAERTLAWLKEWARPTPTNSSHSRLAESMPRNAKLLNDHNFYQRLS